MLYVICKLVLGETPVVCLNYTVLSNGASFDRDTVEICIREIFQVLNKAIAADRSVSLDFPHIGRLIFKDKKVRMRFFKGFVQSMDKTGKMEKAFVSSYVNVLFYCTIVHNRSHKVQRVPIQMVHSCPIQILS